MDPTYPPTSSQRLHITPISRAEQRNYLDRSLKERKIYPFSEDFPTSLDAFLKNLFADLPHEISLRKIGSDILDLFRLSQTSTVDTGCDEDYSIHLPPEGSVDEVSLKIGEKLTKMKITYTEKVICASKEYWRKLEFKPLKGKRIGFRIIKGEFHQGYLCILDELMVDISGVVLKNKAPYTFVSTKFLLSDFLDCLRGDYFTPIPLRDLPESFLKEMENSGDRSESQLALLIPDEVEKKLDQFVSDTYQAFFRMAFYIAGRRKKNLLPCMGKRLATKDKLDIRQFGFSLENLVKRTLEEHTRDDWEAQSVLLYLAYYFLNTHEDLIVLNKFWPKLGTPLSKSWSRAGEKKHLGEFLEALRLAAFFPNLTNPNSNPLSFKRELDCRFAGSGIFILSGWKDATVQLVISYEPQDFCHALINRSVDSSLDSSVLKLAGWDQVAIDSLEKVNTDSAEGDVWLAWAKKYSKLNEKGKFCSEFSDFFLDRLEKILTADLDGEVIWKFCKDYVQQEPLNHLLPVLKRLEVAEEREVEWLRGLCFWELFPLYSEKRRLKLSRRYVQLLSNTLKSAPESLSGLLGERVIQCFYCLLKGVDEWSLAEDGHFLKMLEFMYERKIISERHWETLFSTWIHERGAQIDSSLEPQVQLVLSKIDFKARNAADREIVRVLQEQVENKRPFSRFVTLDVKRSLTREESVDVSEKQKIPENIAQAIQKRQWKHAYQLWKKATSEGKRCEWDQLAHLLLSTEGGEEFFQIGWEQSKDLKWLNRVVDLDPINRNNSSLAEKILSWYDVLIQNGVSNKEVCKLIDDQLGWAQRIGYVAIPWLKIRISNAAQWPERTRMPYIKGFTKLILNPQILHGLTLDEAHELITVCSNRLPKKFPRDEWSKILYDTCEDTDPKRILVSLFCLATVGYSHDQRKKIKGWFESLEKLPHPLNTEQKLKLAESFGEHFSENYWLFLLEGDQISSRLIEQCVIDGGGEVSIQLINRLFALYKQRSFEFDACFRQKLLQVASDILKRNPTYDSIEEVMSGLKVLAFDHLPSESANEPCYFSSLWNYLNNNLIPNEVLMDWRFYFSRVIALYPQIATWFHQVPCEEVQKLCESVQGHDYTNLGKIISIHPARDLLWESYFKHGKELLRNQSTHLSPYAFQNGIFSVIVNNGGGDRCLEMFRECWNWWNTDEAKELLGADHEHMYANLLKNLIKVEDSEELLIEIGTHPQSTELFSTNQDAKGAWWEVVVCCDPRNKISKYLKNDLPNCSFLPLKVLSCMQKKEMHSFSAEGAVVSKNVLTLLKEDSHPLAIKFHEDLFPLSVAQMSSSHFDPVEVENLLNDIHPQISSSDFKKRRLCQLGKLIIQGILNDNSLLDRIFSSQEMISCEFEVLTTWLNYLLNYIDEDTYKNDIYNYVAKILSRIDSKKLWPENLRTHLKMILKLQMELPEVLQTCKEFSPEAQECFKKIFDLVLIRENHCHSAIFQFILDSVDSTDKPDEYWELLSDLIERGWSQEKDAKRVWIRSGSPQYFQAISLLKKFDLKNFGNSEKKKIFFLKLATIVFLSHDDSVPIDDFEKECLQFLESYLGSQDLTYDCFADLVYLEKISTQHKIPKIKIQDFEKKYFETFKKYSDKISGIQWRECFNIYLDMVHSAITIKSDFDFKLQFLTHQFEIMGIQPQEHYCSWMDVHDIKRTALLLMLPSGVLNGSCQIPMAKQWVFELIRQLACHARIEDFKISLFNGLVAKIPLASQVSNSPVTLSDDLRLLFYRMLYLWRIKDENYTETDKDWQAVVDKFTQQNTFEFQNELTKVLEELKILFPIAQVRKEWSQKMGEMIKSIHQHFPNHEKIRDLYFSWALGCGRFWKDLDFLVDVFYHLSSKFPNEDVSTKLPTILDEWVLMWTFLIGDEPGYLTVVREFYEKISGKIKGPESVLKRLDYLYKLTNYFKSSHTIGLRVGQALQVRMERDEWEAFLNDNSVGRIHVLFVGYNMLGMSRTPEGTAEIYSWLEGVKDKLELSVHFLSNFVMGLTFLPDVNLREEYLVKSISHVRNSYKLFSEKQNPLSLYLGLNLMLSNYFLSLAEMRLKCFTLSTQAQLCEFCRDFQKEFRFSELTPLNSDFAESRNNVIHAYDEFLNKLLAGIGASHFLESKVESSQMETQVEILSMQLTFLPVFEVIDRVLLHFPDKQNIPLGLGRLLALFIARNTDDSSDWMKLIVRTQVIFDGLGHLLNNFKNKSDSEKHEIIMLYIDLLTPFELCICAVNSLKMESWRNVVLRTVELILNHAPKDRSYELSLIKINSLTTAAVIIGQRFSLGLRLFNHLMNESVWQKLDHCNDEEVLRIAHFSLINLGLSLISGDKIPKETAVDIFEKIYPNIEEVIEFQLYPPSHERIMHYARAMVDLLFISKTIEAIQLNHFDINKYRNWVLRCIQKSHPRFAEKFENICPTAKGLSGVHVLTAEERGLLSQILAEFMNQPALGICHPGHGQ